MGQPLVSVVIPVYNVEKYLNSCIDSVVKQIYKNLEIVLVDDGSTDNSPAMCDEWAEKDSRIKVIHKENAGAGYARNTGLDNVTGKYVLFIDSDDYIDVRTVEVCVNAVENDKSDLAMFGRVDVHPDGQTVIKPILTDKYVFRNDDVTNDLFPSLFTNSKGFGMGVCGKMIDLDIIKSNCLRFRSEREFLSEDALFLTELFAHISAVSVIPDNFYYYVQNSSSFSRTYKKEYCLMNDNFLTAGEELCGKHGYSDKVITHLRARYLIYALEGMKRIFISETAKSEKKSAFKQFYDNRLLRSVLTEDVLKLSKRPAKLFWSLYKLRLYGLCRVLLWLKTQK